MKLSVKYSPSLLINFFHNLPPSLSLLFDLFLFDLLYTLNILSLLAPLSPPPPLILLLQQIPPIAKNKPRQINHMQSPAIYLQNLIECDLQPRRSTSREPWELVRRRSLALRQPVTRPPARTKWTASRQCYLRYAEADRRLFPPLTHMTTNLQYPSVHPSFHPFVHTEVHMYILPNRQIHR